MLFLLYVCQVLKYTEVLLPETVLNLSWIPMKCGADIYGTLGIKLTDLIETLIFLVALS